MKKPILCKFCNSPLHISITEEEAICSNDFCQEKFVWNPNAWNYRSKQYKNKDGTISYEKLGTWVTK